ncbi:MAG: hypothetical protein WCI57_01220, partial [Candidatus Berkelbacteria bacterium]
MPIFDYLKKSFPKKVKKGTVDEVLASKDKVQISQLVEKEVTVDQQRLDLFEQKMKIEKEITAIQRSTRVSMPVFASLHNTLRMKYQWYYKWHMTPFSSLVHWLALSSFSTVILAVVVTVLFTNTVVRTFADTRHAWDTKDAWSTWNLSNVVADDANTLLLARLTLTTSGETVVSGESAVASGTTTEEALVADYAPTGTATLTFSPWKKEVVDWLAAESKETLNGGVIKKEYSTDNILFTEDIANLADSETLYIRLTFSTADPKISPVLSSLAVNYSRLPYAPEGVTFESKQVLFATSQVLSAGAFIDPDDDDHAASQWQITTLSGDFTSPVLDQTVTSSDASNLTSLTLKNSLDAGNYFARVRYKDSKGAWSLWSQEASFTVAKPEGQKTSVQNNGTAQVAANPNEILVNRTETTKTIDNKNGTKTLESYTGIVHYKEDYASATSQWKDINPNHSIDTAEYVLFDEMPSTVKVFKDKIGYEIESRQTGDKYTVILKDVDGTPVLSRTTGSNNMVAWADINTPEQKKINDTRDALAKWIAPAALADDSQVTKDNGNLKFEFDISEYGVRLWKTIKGEDAPKNFKWDITKTDGTKPGTVVVTDPETKKETTVVAKDDLKFRDKPEAFDVTPATGEVVKDAQGQDKVVPIEAKKIEGDLNSTFVWQETAPKSDMKIDTDVNYYPQTNDTAGAKTTDGVISWFTGRGVTWSEMRSGNSGGYVSGIYTAPPGYYAYDGICLASRYGLSNGWSDLCRAYASFDTSSIPDSATIDSATMSIYGKGTYNGAGESPEMDINIFGSTQASASQLVAADFTAVGTTPFSNAITKSNWAYDYNNFAFNAAGKGAISKSGVSKFSIYNGNFDAANVSPTPSATDFSTISMYFSEASGTSQDPKLSVTYSGGQTISGTIYSDTSKSSNVGSGIPIAISSNGGGKMTGVTGANGTFSFSGVEVIQNKPITVFVDGGPFQSALVVKPNSVGDISGLEMYVYKTVLTYQATGTGDYIENADLAIADDCGCFSDFSVSGSTLSANEIFIPTGKNYIPFGDVSIYTLTQYGNVTMNTNAMTTYNLYQYGGTYSAGSGAEYIQNLYLAAGVLNAGSSTMTLTGYQTSIAGGTFNSNSATITLLDTSFSMTSGTFNAPTGDLTVMTDSSGYYSQYTWNVSGGTYNHNNGTLKIGAINNNYYGNPYTFNTMPSLYNLTYANTSSGYPSFNSDITIANNLSITNGSFSGSGTINVANNVSISGGAYFSPSTITIGGSLLNDGGSYSAYTTTFNNVAKTSQISGNNDFYTFNCTTPGKTLQFMAGSTQNIYYDMNVVGTSGSPIIMTKYGNAAPINQWFFNANQYGMSPWNIDYVTVSYSNNKNAQPIAPTHWTDGGNNTNWIGSHVTGTAYQYVGGGSNVGSNVPVSISVNGGSKQTIYTGNNGSFDFVVGGMVANTPITIFYEQGQNYYSGSLVTVSAGSGDITGLSLYQYAVTLSNQNAAPITNTILATADNSNDSQLLFSVDGSNNFSTNYSIYVPSGKVYTPGAGVTTYGAFVDGTLNASASFTSYDMGSFYVENGGVFNAGSGTVTVGSLYLTGGTFNSNSSTLLLNGYSTYISSGTFNSNTATITVKSYNFNLYGGTFNAPSGTLTLDASNVSNDFNFDISGGGTFVHNNGLIQINNVYSSNKYYVRTGNNHLYYLQANSSSGTVAIQDTLRLDYELSISNGNTFDAYGYALETVNFVQTSGYFSAPYGTMKVSGAFNNSGGSFSNNWGTVELNGGAGTTQTVYGSTTFYNFTMTATSARTINFNAGTNQTVQGQWTATGTAGNQLSLARDGGAGQWEITPSTSMGNQWTVDYVTVSNSKNDASAPISPAHWVNGGNNINWVAQAGCVWDGGGSDNNWSTAANWTLDAVPTAACDVVFDSTSTKASTLDSGFTAHVKSLSINTGYTNTVALGADLNDDGDINLGAGTLSAGNYTLNIAGSWNNTGGLFSKATSTVNFNATDAKTINDNGQNFTNITIAGTGSTASDNFDSGTISSDRWTTSGTVSNVSNKAQFTVSSYNGASYIQSKNVLSGDYDIQYDYDLSGMSTPNTNYAGMYLISNGVQLAVAKNTSGTCYYYTYDGTQYTDYTNDCTGKLRVVRSGSNMTTYRWVSSSSSWAVSQALSGKSTADTTPQIMMYNPSYVTTIATADNYLVNSGTVVGGGVAGTYSLLHTLTATGTFRMTSGSFNSGANDITTPDFTQTGGIFIAPSTNMYVRKDFAHTAGTFTHNSGTMNFVMNSGQSNDQNISGNTTFNNLVMTAADSAARLVKFESGKTQTIVGTTTITGASGREISLNSSSSGSQWSIDPQGARAISYVSVKDSINANATAIYANNSGTNLTNAGNDVNWFVPYSISGTAYTSDAKSATVANGTTVGLSINGGAKSEVTTTTGVFTFTGKTVAANDTLTFYLNGGTYTGNLITQAVDGTTNITGLEIYANDIVISHETSGPMTNTLLATANNCSDCGTSIKYTDTAGAVAFGAGYKVWVATGKTYTPGNTVSAESMTIAGTFTPGSATVTISGSGTPFVNSGTFNQGTSTVVYTGASATNVSGSTYYNLQTNHAAVVFTAAGDTTVTNVFTISAGTFDASSRTITLSGTATPFVKTGTFTPSTSTILYTGNTSGVNITPATYYNLTLNNAATTFTAAGDISISNVITITAGIFDASSRTITLSGTGTPFIKTGTFTPSTSTITYTGGTAAVNVTAATYYNLIVNKAATIYTAAGDITVSNVFTITAGTFDGSSRTITLSGTNG